MPKDLVKQQVWRDGFKVEDYYESYFDEKTGAPYKFIRNT